MHQIILLTAMTATTGLFGGGRGCGGGHCGRQAPVCHSAPVCYQQAYYAQPCAPCGYGYAAPVHGYATPQAAPAPQMAPPAPAKAAMAPQPGYYNPAAYYYYPAAPASSCPTGNCPYR